MRGTMMDFPLTLDGDSEASRKAISESRNCFATAGSLDRSN